MLRATVTIFLTWVSILACLGPLRADTFQDPAIPDGEVVHYRYETADYANDFLTEVKQGEEISESTSLTRVLVQEDGRKIYHTETTGLRRGGFRFEHVTEILVGEDVRPLRFVATDRNERGRVIRELEAVFDDPTLRYPDSTFPVFSLVQVMRGIPFETDRTVHFHIWITPTEIFLMSARVVRQETVEVPAGRIPCYVVEMKPDIRTILPVGNFLARLLGPFIPKYHFWFAERDSHVLVRFEGALGGAGAAKQTIELTGIEQRTLPAALAARPSLSTH